MLYNIKVHSLHNQNLDKLLLRNIFVGIFKQFKTLIDYWPFTNLIFYILEEKKIILFNVRQQLIDESDWLCLNCYDINKTVFHLLKKKKVDK